MKKMATIKKSEKRILKKRERDHLESLRRVHASMTDGERRVIELLARDVLPASAAEVLGLTVGAVNARIRKIRAKLAGHELDALLGFVLGRPAHLGVSEWLENFDEHAPDHLAYMAVSLRLLSVSRDTGKRLIICLQVQDSGEVNAFAVRDRKGVPSPPERSPTVFASRQRARERIDEYRKQEEKGADVHYLTVAVADDVAERIVRRGKNKRP